MARDQLPEAYPAPAGTYDKVSTGDRAIDLLIESPPLAASAPVAVASMPGRDRLSKASAGKASGTADPEIENLRDALLRDAATLATAEPKHVRATAEEAVAEGEPEGFQAADVRPASDGLRVRGDESAAGGPPAGLVRVINMLREHRHWVLGVALATAGLAAGLSRLGGSNGRARRTRSVSTRGSSRKAAGSARRSRGKR